MFQHQISSANLQTGIEKKKKEKRKKRKDRSRGSCCGNIGGANKHIKAPVTVTKGESLYFSDFLPSARTSSHLPYDSARDLPVYTYVHIYVYI